MDRNIAPPPGTTDFPVRDDADLVAAAMQFAAHPQAVPVNMYESEGAVVIVAAVPGVMADDIEIEVQRDKLWIRAQARTIAPKPYILHEWHYGPYERLVELPPAFEGDVLAHHGNGQLAIRVGRGGARVETLIVYPGEGSFEP